MFFTNKSFFALPCAVLFLLFTSCSTLKGDNPDKNQNLSSGSSQKEYSEDDILQNEIERINTLMQSEPVRALWKALLTGNEDVIKRTSENLNLLFEDAMEQKDYFSAKKYYKSLISSGFKIEKYTSKQIDGLYSDDIPGLSKKNAKNPHNISDCMNATVTVWVDRGLSVKNGAGFADIVIGSGFFIDKRGYIVTNHHVIESMVDPKYEGFSRLYIRLLQDPDTKIPAKVIGYDPVLDLALLKTEIEPEFVLNLGSSKDLKLGDKVSAIGTPLGLEGTLTSGIISSTERKLFTLGNVFQIDAAVNSGNSGGPLIDENLTVQAIVFAGMPQYQGLNFAIPVEYLKQELHLLYHGDEIKHPWIACYGHTKRDGMKKTGLEIQYLMPAGSALLSGLKIGDVITEIDGHKITSLEDFQFLLMGYEPETLLTCKYLDEDEKECSVLLYLQQRPEHPGLEIYNSDLAANAFVPLFGMKLIPSSTLNRNSYTINYIIKGSAADEMSFSENDIVQIRSLKPDKENECIFAMILTRRRKKGFLDLSLLLSASYDGPYYF